MCTIDAGISIIHRYYVMQELDNNLNQPCRWARVQSRQYSNNVFLPADKINTCFWYNCWSAGLHFLAIVSKLDWASTMCWYSYGPWIEQAYSGSFCYNYTMYFGMFSCLLFIHLLSVTSFFRQPY